METNKLSQSGEAASYDKLPTEIKQLIVRQYVLTAIEHPYINMARNIANPALAPPKPTEEVHRRRRHRYFKTALALANVNVESLELVYHELKQLSKLVHHTTATAEATLNAYGDVFWKPLVGIPGYNLYQRDTSYSVFEHAPHYIAFMRRRAGDEVAAGWAKWFEDKAELFISYKIDKAKRFLLTVAVRELEQRVEKVVNGWVE